MGSDKLEQYDLSTGTYGYSAASLDSLGATEYTLVTIAVDVSGSVGSYKKEMEDSIKEVVKACLSSPRADNLMIRIVTFDTTLVEMHGFKLLTDCNEDDYNDCLTIGGMTSLYDASQNSIEAMQNYAKNLNDNEFDVNGIIVIITDGCDNASNVSTMDGVKKSLEDVVKQESLQSLLTILVGVGINQTVSQSLTEFKDKTGLTQYVEIKEANAKNLAKLAKFVSKSISAQSKSLGTGSMSIPLTF